MADKTSIQAVGGRESSAKSRIRRVKGITSGVNMRPRVMIGRLLIRAGMLIQAIGIFIQRLSRFTQSMAVMVMKPDDLVEFSQESYSRGKSVDYFSREDLVDSGLNPDETAIFKMIPLEKGKLLLLGLGGGREAIYFSRIGFEVAGVDFVPEMVEKAKENAASLGLKIIGLVKDMSKLDLGEAYYDVIWISAGMYSSIPTKERRIAMLQTISKFLKERGYLICTFSYDKTYSVVSPIRELAKKALALMTLGNFWYEKGDIISSNSEFLHFFSSAEELSSEFESGGFEAVQINIPKKPMPWSLALLTKKN
jgi:ubiquinone/menaquinone biosynthesis C-methylase UbiE